MKRKANLRRKKKTSRRKSSKSRSRHNLKRFNLKKILLGLFAIFVIYLGYLNFEVIRQFDGKKWSVPATVYARPLELYVGKPLDTAQLDFELFKTGFRYSDSQASEGTYQKRGKSYRIITRSFDFWDGHQPPRYIELSIEDGFITRLEDFRDNNELDVVRIEPAIIGRIYPAHREDRLLVKLEDVPDELIQALIFVEDRDYYNHLGVNPKAILRALLANIKAGGIVQGGSTLTQQLVKNFFLTREKSLWRKMNEALMAVLLEIHYDKKEILEAYLNEIYLGQDKNRAIHGFGLASQFYFDKPLFQLEVQELATLVAMVRGPSYYDPFKRKQRLLKRRNRVIALLHENNIISASEKQNASQKSLGVISKQKIAHGKHPAFMTLLKRQLQKDYDADDLASEGLRIFSTLDLYVQTLVEKSVSTRVKQLDRQNRLKGNLQTAVVVTNVNNADVIAMVGDRNPGYAGFNRALDANRPIGSLVKPAVYLTALEEDKYHLSTMIRDEPITLKSEDGTLWSPSNYSGESHGEIPLFKALVNSYNQATVRLGLKLGFEDIAATIRKLGINRDIPPYPSMLLGALPMSPFEVTQMYQTIAAEGFIAPLHTITKVMTADGQPLKHYPVKVVKKIDENAIRILNSALHEVTRQGTARSLQWRLPQGYRVAGKTGTTNDTRDSWFAGFSQEHLIVSWLGTDDNQETGLTGSSGALVLWSDIMTKIRTRPFEFAISDELEYFNVEGKTGRLVDNDCRFSAYLAYRKEITPTEYGRCTE